MAGTSGSWDSAPAAQQLEAVALATRAYGLTPLDRLSLCPCIPCQLAREEIPEPPAEPEDPVCPGCGRRHSRGWHN